MSRAGDATRAKILDAAEEVIATRGVDAATFAAINELAGQRNNSATQYHFGDRVGLLGAVVERHVERIDRRRAELLDALGAGATLHQLVATLVTPLVELLGDESGRRYLIIQAALLSHPDRSTWPDELARPWTRRGVGPVAGLMAARPDVAGGDPGDVRREMMSQLIFHSLASRAREGSHAISDGDYAAALISVLVSVIEADADPSPG